MASPKRKGTPSKISSKGVCKNEGTFRTEPRGKGVSHTQTVNPPKEVPRRKQGAGGVRKGESYK